MFEYLIVKIQRSEIQCEPFPHIYIKQFFSPDDFRNLILSDEIQVGPQADDESLIAQLYSRGYEIIHFSGCITDAKTYLKWHKHKSTKHSLNKTSCEGFGMVLRLRNAKTPIVENLSSFLSSEAFNKAIAAKFNIQLEATTSDNGIQKYLDGYEISPHPDIRKKALTYMVNVNPHQCSEQSDHHTHYLKLTNRYKYVEEFWRENTQLDTCWVPWSWCKTIWEQRENNSMVIFSPSYNTLHGVKASYNHLTAQRTQLYGNLWYKDASLNLYMPNWESMDICNLIHADKAAIEKVTDKKSIFTKAKALIPKRLKRYLKRTDLV
jgi:hypothetical protein